MDHKIKKMKFLAIKLSALKSELKISRDILETASREVNEMYQDKFFPEVSTPVESSDNKDLDNKEPEQEQQEPKPNQQKQEEQSKQAEESQEISETKNKNADPEVKKLWRKISFKIHPDKLIGLEDGFEKEKKTNLYAKARAAYEDNDIIILSDVALEIGIEIPEISEERLKKAEKEISNIKKELNHIESTFVWNWFFTENRKKKDAILERLFKLMYEANNKDNLGS
tara:strand:- start:18638 stop:19318 length:681 start_codon:yes stop_codon:yes gene_type:complete